MRLPSLHCSSSLHAFPFVSTQMQVTRGFGAVVWDCAVVMASYLYAHKDTVLPPGSLVLDLSTGTGFVGTDVNVDASLTCTDVCCTTFSVEQWDYAVSMLGAGAGWTCRTLTCCELPSHHTRGSYTRCNPCALRVCSCVGLLQAYVVRSWAPPSSPVTWTSCCRWYGRMQR